MVPGLRKLPIAVPPIRSVCGYIIYAVVWGWQGEFVLLWADENGLVSFLVKEKRKCHYTTVIALKSKNFEETFEYVLSGIVSDAARGENGFGFDEIFELSNGKTLAEISTIEKLKLSPRKEALDMANRYLMKFKTEN